MAMIAAFEPRKTAITSQIFNSVLNNGGSYQSAGGRFGGPCMAFNNEEGGFIIPSLDPHTWTGFAFTLSNLFSLNTILNWYDSANVRQLLLAITQLGSMQFYRGSTANPIGPATANGLIVPGVYYHVQIEALINAAGHVGMRFAGQGAELISFNGNTQATGLANTGHIRWSNFVGSGLKVCHAWVLDSAAVDSEGDPAPNGYQGDGVIKTEVMTSDGGTNVWNPTPAQSAGNHYLNIDDPAPDEDTTYLSAATVGDTEDFGMSPGVTVGPKWANVSARVRIDDAGPRSVKVGIGSGASEKMGPDFAVPGSYAWTLPKCVVNDPATAAAWSAAAYNSAKPKIRVSA